LKKTLGILLAGGRGTRLGLDVPKALALVGGETLLVRATRELSAACQETVLVLPAGLELPTALPVVRDRIAASGPLSALVAGLESREFEDALVLGVDFPRLTRDRLSRLLATHGEEMATVPAPGDRPQPLAAVYSRAAAAPLRHALDSGARAVVPSVLALSPRLLDDRALRAIGLEPADFTDVDTPADLAAFDALRQRSA
jgi:molybdopterin-guanine dinucleotide biosynthesis protein A